MSDNKNEDQTAGKSNFNKDKIAFWITILSFVGTLLIFVAIIILTFIDVTKEGKYKLEILQYGVTAILPLWGTWMGTILAYYFSKANFEAASKSQKDVIKYLTSSDRLASLKSYEESIKIGDIKRLSVQDLEDLKKKTITQLLKFMDDTKENGNPLTRLPIVNPKDVLISIVHKSTLYTFIAEQSLKQKAEGSNIQIVDLTFEAMLKDGSNDIKRYLEQGKQFVSKSSNLKEAQDIIDKNGFCKDVFVTENGRFDEPILGWITDTLLVEKGRV